MKKLSKQVSLIFVSVLIFLSLAADFGKGCNTCYLGNIHLTDSFEEFGQLCYVSTNGYYTAMNTVDCSILMDTLLSSESLNAVANSGLLIIVAGDAGKIFRSSDFGLNWANINSGTSADLNDVAGQSFTYYAVGNAGIILKSTNNGESFFPLNSGTTLDLNEIFVISRDSVRIAADSLTTLFTSNGGATWIRQSVYNSDDPLSGFRVDLQTLHFINYNTGWAAGEHYIFKTTNNGLSWQVRFKQEQTYDNSSNSIYFYNKDSGIVVGNRGDIQYTTNGGSSWFYNINTQNLTTKNLNKFVLSGGIAYAVGDSGVTVYTDSVTLAVEPISSVIPDKYILEQNYPNPFNPSTSIEFSVPRLSFVKIVIYDILGKQIQVLVSEELRAGKYKTDWEGSNFPSGVYFFKLETSGYTQTRKMVLIK